MLVFLAILGIIISTINALEANRLIDQISFHKNISEVQHPHQEYYKYPSDSSKLIRYPLKKDFISPPYYPSRKYYLSMDTCMMTRLRLIKILIKDSCRRSSKRYMEGSVYKS